MKKTTKLAENLFLIDVHDMNMEKRTGTYVLTENQLTIIETSASPSIPYILEGLEELGYSPEDLKYIIVTHIHLDHAGGAGLLLEKCPNAKVVVHPKGLRHLNDPSRLIAGARAVYGVQFERLFSPIVPIPEEKLIPKHDHEELEINNDLSLKFFDTPGHANHHFSIYHPRLNYMFTGDTAGVCYPQLFEEEIELYLPSTSPNQFDPDAMLASLELYKSLNLSKICFGHYGETSNLNEVYRQIPHWLTIFLNAGEKIYHTNLSFEEKVDTLSTSLFQKISEHLAEQKVSRDNKVFDILKVDTKVSSMGLLDYFSKQKI